MVLDSSVWISRIQATDSNHAPARAWVNAHLRTGGLFVAPYIITVEVGAVVSRNTKNRQDARTAVAQLLALPYMRLVSMDTALVDRACDLAITHELASADALFVAVANVLGLPLVTFDRALLRLPSQVVQTVRPQ